ncbi:MAG: helix-turn-helix domain-containing protein [Thermodesulfobacteriota bacterium]
MTRPADAARQRVQDRDSSRRGRSRRPYDARLRRERAAGTRERIVAAGCELLRGSSIRDWRALTLRAVAERAGVNERTVYRHFANERALRDAVMHRLEQQAGIDLAGLRLEDVADVTARIFAHVSTYPRESRPQLDPTLSEAGQRQRRALLAAVTARTPRWRESDRTVAAALFDVFWSVASYERLVADWQLDREQAIRGMTWVVRLVEEAIRDGRRPR